MITPRLAEPRTKIQDDPSALQFPWDANLSLGRLETTLANELNHKPSLVAFIPPSSIVSVCVQSRVQLKSKFWYQKKP